MENWANTPWEAHHPPRASSIGTVMTSSVGQPRRGITQAKTLPFALGLGPAELPLRAQVVPELSGRKHSMTPC